MKVKTRQYEVLQILVKNYFANFQNPNLQSNAVKFRTEIYEKYPIFIQPICAGRFPSLNLAITPRSASSALA